MVQRAPGQGRAERVMGVDRKDMTERSWVADAGWVKCSVQVGGKKICRGKESCRSRLQGWLGGHLFNGSDQGQLQQWPQSPFFHLILTH